MFNGKNAVLRNTAELPPSVLKSTLYNQRTDNPGPFREALISSRILLYVVGVPKLSLHGV